MMIHPNFGFRTQPHIRFEYGELMITYPLFFSQLRFKNPIVRMSHDGFFRVLMLLNEIFEIHDEVTVMFVTSLCW